MIASKVRKPKRLKNVFAKIDKDGSNTIDEDEFRVLVAGSLKKTNRDVPNGLILGLIWSSLFLDDEDTEEATLEMLQRWLFGE